MVDNKIYRNLIFDMSNLYYRNFYTNQDMCITESNDNNKFRTGGIYGSLVMIESFKQKYLSDNGKMYFLFDNFSSKVSERVEIYKEYKCNREHKDPDFYRGIDELNLILQYKYDNAVCIQVPNMEADDLIKPIMEKVDKYDRTLVISNDMDWCRVINDNTKVLMKKNSIYVFYDIEEFEKQYNFNPTENKIILYKTFTGDKSDNIEPAIPHFRHNLVLKLINDFDDVYSLLANINSVDYLTKEHKKKITEHKQQLIRNSMLVSFSNIDPDVFDEYTYPCKYTPTKLLLFYRKYNFQVTKLNPELVFNKIVTKKNEGLDFNSPAPLRRRLQ